MNETQTKRYQGHQEMLTDLWEKDLSARLMGCLKNDRVRYIGQIVQMSETEILRMPNLGRKSLNELKEFLACRDLHLLQPHETKDENINHTTRYEDIASAYNIQTQEKSMNETPKSRYHGDPNMLLRLDKHITGQNSTCLKSGGIIFLGQLVNLSDDEFIQLHLAGQTILHTLKDVIKEFGEYRFREQDEQKMPIETQQLFQKSSEDYKWLMIDSKNISHLQNLQQSIIAAYGLPDNSKMLSAPAKPQTGLPFTKEDFEILSSDPNHAGRPFLDFTVSDEFNEMIRNAKHPQRTCDLVDGIFLSIMGAESIQHNKGHNPSNVRVYYASKTGMRDIATRSPLQDFLKAANISHETLQIDFLKETEGRAKALGLEIKPRAF